MAEAQAAATGFAPFSREEMDLASKDQLIKWCKEYGLDKSGMKYELRLRLLEYIRRQGLLLKGEDPLEDETPAPPEDQAAAAPTPPPESAAGGGEAQAAVELPTEQSPAESPGACANCGGELSYIPQYERWYCYNCDTYAGAAAEGGDAAALEASHAPSHHEAKAGGKAGVGIALALVGVLTFLAYQILFVAPALFPIPVLFTVAPEVLFALPLVAFVLVGVGVIAGLRSLARHHG